MDLSTHHIAVEVSIDGQGPFPFNLDTYAVTTACVDERFAERMGFEKVGTTMNSDGSGEERRLDVVLIPELRLGGATFRDVRALVDDYSWVSTPDGGSIDGLLGYHLFRELLLELDYPGKRIVLREGELPANGDHVVSHSALRTRPDFPLQIGGKRLIIGIDSGAQAGLSLPRSLIDELEFVHPPAIIGRAQTVYSKADVLAGVLAGAVRFAGHEHVRTEASFSEIFGMPMIGHGLMAEYSVTFDQKNGRVRFARPK